MSRDSIEVLLVADSEGGVEALRQFLEDRGCRCATVTRDDALQFFELRAFDLILSTEPLRQSDPLVLALAGAQSRVFYCLPVEDSCWWVPLAGKSRKELGKPALRRREFNHHLDEVLKEIVSSRAENGGASMMMTERLKSVLDNERVSYASISHAPAYGAQYAAALMHVHGKNVAKTVVVRAGTDNLLAVLPASYSINLEKLSSLVHARAELVEEAECKRLFPDCEPGVFPAFGELYGLPVYMDKALAEDPEIVFSAGTRSEGIVVKNKDFLRLVNPRVCSFAEPQHRKPRVREEMQT